MSQNGEEEEGTTGTTGKPNAYWADVRAKQELEALREQGYGGDFRAIKMPKAGPKRVSAKETIGDYATCWCGQPEGHDWPGKDKGRRHPRTPKTTREESPVSAMTDEAPSITRRELRAYHEDLIEVVLRAVNDYGVRYRLRNNGCLLYPPDGSTPYTIHARNSDSQVRDARKWFVNHIVGFTEEKGHPLAKVEALAEDFDMREKTRMLAEKLNTEEHPVPEKETPTQRRNRKERERRAAVKAAQPAPSPAPPLKARQEPASDADRQPPADFHVRETGDYEEGWELWHTKAGDERPDWETDGTWVRCRLCGWATSHPHRVSSHTNTKHNPETQAKMWGQEAQQLKRETRAKHGLERSIHAAVEILNKAVGKTEADTSGLEKRIATLTAERDQWKSKADDLQARLDLMKEALRA